MMKKEEKNYWNTQKAEEEVIAFLQQNKLVIGTTDTVLGLFALANKEGFELLNKVKERENKPYLLIAPSTGSIDALVNRKKSFHIEKIMKAFWPGPLTIIFKAQEGVADYFVSEQKTIAIRIPDHKGIHSLLQKTGPLFSTSANKAGQPLPELMSELSPEIAQYGDYFIDDKVPQKNETPSTLIDCSELTKDNPVVKVIREGKITVQELQDVLGDTVKVIA